MINRRPAATNIVSRIERCSPKAPAAISATSNKGGMARKRPVSPSTATRTVTDTASNTPAPLDFTVSTSVAMAGPTGILDPVTTPSRPADLTVWRPCTAGRPGAPSKVVTPTSQASAAFGLAASHSAAAALGSLCWFRIASISASSPCRVKLRLDNSRPMFGHWRL